VELRAWIRRHLVLSLPSSAPQTKGRGLARARGWAIGSARASRARAAGELSFFDCGHGMAHSLGVRRMTTAAAAGALEAKRRAPPLTEGAETTGRIFGESGDTPSNGAQLAALVRRDSQDDCRDCRDCRNNAGPDTTTRKCGVINCYPQGFGSWCDLITHG
jgi:hypothetical protein